MSALQHMAQARFALEKIIDEYSTQKQGHQGEGVVPKRRHVNSAAHLLRNVWLLGPVAFSLPANKRLFCINMFTWEPPPRHEHAAQAAGSRTMDLLLSQVNPTCCQQGLQLSSQQGEQQRYTQLPHVVSPTTVGCRTGASQGAADYTGSCQLLLPPPGSAGVMLSTTWSSKISCGRSRRWRRHTRSWLRLQSGRGMNDV
jgi:hypothetical protein